MKTFTHFRKTGFTLTELIVVVSIIAILCSVSVPVYNKVVTKAHRAKAISKERTMAERDYAAGVQLPAKPIMESSELDLALESTDHRMGLEVYTRFVLTGEGSFVFRAPSGHEGEVAFFLPFPQGTIEVRHVLLTLTTAREPEPFEPDDVEYSLAGIRWQGRAEEAVTATVEFVTAGQEQFALRMPAALRLRELDIALDLTEVPEGKLPDYSLQPSRSDGGLHRWEFTNLVSERPIVVELPNSDTMMGRLVVLIRFMALSVLAFGAGFWFLTEQVKPGHLKNFRWAHFLLLASNYLLFFFIFIVLVSKGEMGLLPAVGISLLGSMPLLAIHVSRLIDVRFALTRILPFAVITLGLMINGVYGGEWSDYVYIGCAVVAFGYLTLSYRPKIESSGDPLQAEATA